MKKKLEIFDPAMCCPTGVCGPIVDPALVRFSADLDWLRSQGVEVIRYNLAQQPQAFVDTKLVRSALEKDASCLPLILVSGRIVKEREYPSRAELVVYLGVKVEADSLVRYSPEVAELVAIGASIASNCLACFRFHHDKAVQLGVSKETIAQAVNTAKAVKKASDEKIVALADKTLSGDAIFKISEASSCCAPSKLGKPGSSCCG